jgi:hypothetical protein
MGRRDLMGRDLQLDLRANGLSQGPKKDLAGHLARRVEGRLSKNLANRRGDLIGYPAVVAEHEAESPGPGDLAPDQQKKEAERPRLERDLNLAVSRAVDSESLEDFRSQVDFQSPAGRERLIAASRAAQSAVVHFGQVGGRGAESAGESGAVGTRGELSHSLLILKRDDSACVMRSGNEAGRAQRGPLCLGRQLGGLRVRVSHVSESRRGAPKCSCFVDFAQRNRRSIDIAHRPQRGDLRSG